MYGKLLERVGRSIVRHRLWILVILFWVGLAAFMAATAPSLTKVGIMDESMFLPSKSGYLQAKEILREKFPDQGAAGQGILVFYDSNGLSTADLDYAKSLAAWLTSPNAPDNVDKVTSIFDRSEMKDVLISQDHQAMLMPVTFTTADYDPQTNRAVQTIREHVLATVPEGLAVYLTGPAGMGRDMFKVILDSVDKTTLATIFLVILVLLLVYRSPVAALVPLVSIASAYLVTRGILGYAAQAGFKLSSLLDAMIVVLIFGVGTDYALFFISRFREEIGEGNDRTEAMIRSVAKIGPVITASAATVIIGLLGMMVADFGLTRSNGPAESLGIFIALLAALSLTPALLQLFGAHLFWPFHRRLGKTRVGQGLINWQNIGQFVTAHPVLVSVIVIGGLLLPYPAWMHTKSAFNILSEIPSNMGSTQGFRVIQDHFSTGEFAPVTVILTSDRGGLLHPDALRDIARVSQTLARMESVDKVRSVVWPTGDPAQSDMLRVDGQLSLFVDKLGEMRGALDHPDRWSQKATKGGQPNEAFDTLRAYLDELGTAFPDVKNDPAYASAKDAEDTLATQMQTMMEKARVDHQLTVLADRIEGMTQQMADPAALVRTGQDGNSAAGFAMLRDYLEELGTAYPEVKNQPEYQDARAALGALQKRLVDMQAQLLVVDQLKGMAGRMRGLQKTMTNPQALTRSGKEPPGQSPAAGLKSLADYLRGLARAYPEVQRAPAYQDALARLQGVQEAMTAIQQQASVANQLALLVQRLQGLQKTLTTPQTMAQVGEKNQHPVQGLDMVAAYLKELAAAYPQVAQTPPYKDAQQRVQRLKAAFAQMAQARASGVTAPPAHQQAALQTLQKDMEGLLSDLQAMQRAFAQHPEAVLVPKNLPTPPEAVQSMKQVQDNLDALAGDLDALAATFAREKPRATYAPAGTMSRPEVQRALSETREDMSTLARDLRGLARHFQGKNLFFFPKHVAGQGGAAQALTGVKANLDRLEKTLDTLAQHFRGKDAYFIPQTFLEQRPELRSLLKTFLSRDGTATQITVLLSGDPYSMQTADTIDRLKETLQRTMAQTRRDGGHVYKAYVGGVPVMSHDLKRTVDRDFGKVQAVVIAGVFLVLVVLLRSLVAPIYLVLTVLLSYGTTMGLTTFIFQNILGQEGVNYILPIMVFVLLVALGADYNIFLMSRVQEESEKVGDVRKGIRLASMYTGGIITSCGIILAGTFGALAVSPLRMLVQMGAAVAIGVLVDTFIVRTLLVPAIATLLGKWNWWPHRG